MKRNPLLPSLLALTLGALVFMAGLTLARTWLPEWHTPRLPGKSFFVGRYRELARQAGARLDGGEPQVSITNRQKEMSPEAERLDSLDAETAVGMGGGLLVDVKQQAALPEGETAQELLVSYLPSGNPWTLRWGNQTETVKTTLSSQYTPTPALQERLMRLLLRPGETLGAEVPSKDVNGQILFYPILGSQPPQRIVTARNSNAGLLFLHRQLGDVAKDNRRVLKTSVAEILLIAVPLVCGILTVIVSFLVLLGKRRIDFVSGLRLALFLLVVAAVSLLAADLTWVGVLSIVGAGFLSLWAFVMWSTGESFLRAVLPGSMVSLDALRAGRFGPRGGQALLAGVAFGSILAGFRLAALALAARLPGVWPDDPSLRLPFFREITPFFDGVVLASGVALALGLAYRFLPPRWAPWAAALAAGLALPFTSLRPLGWQVAADVAAAGLLVLAGRRGGLAAILSTALVACLLPAAAFSLIHLSWLPAPFAVSAGFPALLLVLGLVSLRRPEEAERERLKQPAFIRRMEEEKRLGYEMDLLARMQRELLPQAPDVPGWQIAVRSILATEAGGDLYDFVRDTNGNLWIAAGDVAGHGYSCAIVQAMTAAALTSTITAILMPSEVLKEVDRVIRRGGAHRNFTSLALVRLDPRTGEALLGNAGHPFPLLLAHGGDVEEINLPGLPLGQGPQRTYSDFRFSIPPGGALVFCSDGLFEAADPRENQYGYERPRDLLRDLGDRSAEEILEALFADWRSYMRSDGPPADDTTVLVLKRL